MDTADASWEEAVEAYARRYEAIQAELPATVRDLVERYYLHDADVLSMGQDGDTFVISLHLECPPREVLVLLYTLDAPPEILPDAAPGSGTIDALRMDV